MISFSCLVHIRSRIEHDIGKGVIIAVNKSEPLDKNWANLHSEFML